MVSCVKAGTRLDRPRSPAVPPVVRALLVGQPRRLELGRLIWAGALLIPLAHGAQRSQRRLLRVRQSARIADGQPGRR